MEALLDRVHALPVDFYADAPPDTKKPAYAGLASLRSNAFKFTTRELLHALGTKLANLPANDQDGALSAAWLYMKVLDHSRSDIGLVPAVLEDADLLRNRSHELGVGFACLVASRVWHIPWEQLAPIPGRGRRFDYRGEADGLTAIFEAKGTVHATKQPSQVRDGIDKKKTRHASGKRCDVELVVSTLVGKLSVGSKLLIADPPIDIPEDTFGQRATKFYFLRHWARVMQFVGAGSTAYALATQARELLKPNTFRRGPIYRTREVELSRVEAQDGAYLGSWRDSFTPTRSSRYRHLGELNDRLATIGPDVEVFQGARRDVVERMMRGDPFGAGELAPGEAAVVPANGFRVSRFPDGSALAIRLRSNGGDNRPPKRDPKQVARFETTHREIPESLHEAALGRRAPPAEAIARKFLK